MDCGPACLRMVAKHFGRSVSLQLLREKSKYGRAGVSLLGINEAAGAIGLRTLVVKLDFKKFVEDVPLPCIVYWRQKHFMIVYKVSHSSRFFKRKLTVHIADPSKGLTNYSQEEFLDGWINAKTDNHGEGIALILEPTPRFYEMDYEDNAKQIKFSSLFSYLLPYKQLITQLFLGLFVGSILQLIFPFLTQAIVDVGINTKNLSFIYVILAAQLTLFAGRTSIDFIRSWILLHISARINVSILSDFLIKLMKLPLSFFDVKQFGDIMQRLNDHHRIEAFLTNTSLTTLFSLFNLCVFGVVLALYNLPIFFIFIISSGLYVGWVMLFLNRRRSIDFKRFEAESKNQSETVQLIQGMQEIKLANAEAQKRWEWEGIQARLFKLNVRGLALNQYQQAGAFFLNEGKNIFITFFAAKAVIEGQLTLGAMLAVQYIIGQMNSPVEQLTILLQTTQDAKISLERLNDIHALDDEEPAHEQKVNYLIPEKSFSLSRVTFYYPGSDEDPVLKGINMHIPFGKTTAIVGTSGSGKTTLLKLLLKFYAPSEGEIALGETKLHHINHKLWRSQCGVVMQDGFLFSDTITRNIAIGDEEPDIHRIMYAARIANIQDFVESLPLGYNTKIGAEGKGISQGQKQRILIARAVYKDPAFIFLDEATNALDANNERLIMQNLEEFFIGRTVIVVAHRLSTVSNAAQIIVLEKGEIVETGTHEQLTSRRGNYYHLVKNQLELGT